MFSPCIKSSSMAPSHKLRSRPNYVWSVWQWSENKHHLSKLHLHMSRPQLIPAGSKNVYPSNSCVRSTILYCYIYRLNIWLFEKLLMDSTLLFHIMLLYDDSNYYIITLYHYICYTIMRICLHDNISAVHNWNQVSYVQNINNATKSHLSPTIKFVKDLVPQWDELCQFFPVMWIESRTFVFVARKKGGVLSRLCT